MPPPQLPADAPVAQVLVPPLKRPRVPRRVEAQFRVHSARAIVAPLRERNLRVVLVLLVRHRTQGLAGESIVRHLHVPLVRQVRLDHRVRAVRVPDAVPVRLDGLDQPAGPELLDHLHPRVLARQPHEHRSTPEFLRVVPPVLVGDRRVGPHHVDHLQIVPLTDLPVVRIVRGRHLQEPGRVPRLGVARLRVRHHHVLVFHDRDHAPDHGQLDAQPAQRRRTRVRRIHRHRRVAQVRLRPRGRDGQPRTLVLGHLLRTRVAPGGQLRPRHRRRLVVAVARVRQRVPQVVELPVYLAVLDLVVRQRGLRHRVPVHQTLAAIDEPVLEQPKERLAHRPRAHLVHRETPTVPVRRRPHPLELLGDRRLVLVLERLHPGHERLAPVLVSALPLLLQQPLLHTRLGRDPRVVRPRQPQRLEPHHPVRPHQHVLQCAVERMSDMKPVRDVGRRHQDAIRPGPTAQHTRRVRRERPGTLPQRPDPSLVLRRCVLRGQIARFLTDSLGTLARIRHKAAV